MKMKSLGCTMKSKPTTCGSGGKQARRVKSGLFCVRAQAWIQTPPAILWEGQAKGVWGGSISSSLSIFTSVLLIGICLTLSGCENASVVANPDAVRSQTTVAVPQSESETPTEEKPKRLKRGEMPDEWKEEQRERVVPMDTTGDKLDLTFDDLKFDIEIGQAFERELLSEEVKAFDGKEITISGYMRPSFKAAGLKGFIFVRDDKECCFGPQAAIYDCVRVKLNKGTDTNYLVRPFKIRGDFYLKEREGPDGTIWSIFNMKNAKIER